MSASWEVFSRHLTAVGGAVVRLARDEVHRWLALTIGADPWVGWNPPEFFDTGGEAWLQNRRGGECPQDASESDYRRSAEAAAYGLTSAMLGVAASGSVVLAASPDRPRVTSLLPRHHLVLLPESRIVPDLAAALRRFSADTLPSQLLFVTGPSRTSDIENDLTIGVHGPAQVTVALIHP